MIYRVFLIATLLCVSLMGAAYAGAPAYIKAHVPNAAMQGQGRLHVFALDVYDAALYAPRAKAAPDKPLAIAITYLRPLTSARIVSRSIDEMKALGYNDPVQLQSWEAQLAKIIPDVTPQTVITGVRTTDGDAVFYKDGVRIGQIKDKTFAQAFFNIWLDSKTSSPSLRRKMLGQSN